MYFFQPSVLLLGFICSKEGRRPDPKKVEQLRAWPPYKSAADVVSHLAFCTYLRGFFGPDFSQQTKPLRACQKKNADFGLYANDAAAQDAREWLISRVLDRCVLVIPDWEAASKPW